MGGWTSAYPKNNIAPVVGRANVVTEVIQVDPPQGAPSGDYADYAPAPGPYNDYTSPSPDMSSPSPTRMPPATSPPADVYDEENLIPTPNPSSQWLWAAIPIESVAPAPAPVPVPVVPVPTKAAPAPAPSGAYKAMGSIFGTFVMAYVLALVL